MSATGRTEWYVTFREADGGRYAVVAPDGGIYCSFADDVAATACARDLNDLNDRLARQDAGPGSPDAAGMCEACQNGDHEDCTDYLGKIGPGRPMCMCIDMEHDDDV